MIWNVFGQQVTPGWKRTPLSSKSIYNASLLGIKEGMHSTPHDNLIEQSLLVLAFFEHTRELINLLLASLGQFLRLNMCKEKSWGGGRHMTPLKQPKVKCQLWPPRSYTEQFASDSWRISPSEANWWTNVSLVDLWSSHSSICKVEALP